MKKEAKGIRPANVRIHNEKLILDYMQNVTSCSATDLVTCTGLSITTVLKLLASLSSIGTIRSVGKATSTANGGKCADLYCINEKYAYSIGGYISDRYISISLMNYSDQIVDYKQFSLEYPLSPEQGVVKFAEEFKNLILRNGISNDNIAAVSVGVDGIVDISNGVICAPITNHNWGNNIPFSKMLQDALPENKFINIDNSGRFGAASVLMQHKRFRTQNVFVLFVSDHTVGCYFENGVIRRGSRGLLGEVGHIRVLSGNDEPKCVCGSRGCFESLVNLETLKKTIMKNQDADVGRGRSTKKEFLSMDDVFSEADKGDKACCKALDKAAEYFAIELRSITLSLDPEVIVICGDYGNAGTYFKEALKKNIIDDSFFGFAEMSHIEFIPKVSSYLLNSGAAYEAMEGYKKNWADTKESS